jgi:hypothetical protein
MDTIRDGCVYRTESMISYDKSTEVSARTCEQFFEDDVEFLLHQFNGARRNSNELPWTTEIENLKIT